MKRSLIVSLIGRPNVGKSSLFNRLTKKTTIRKGSSITLDIPGVTRDRHYGIAHFDDLSDLEGAQCFLVDTGGFYPEKIDQIKTESYDAFFNVMMEHALLAIEESDLVCLVVDVREGLLPYDQQIVDLLREKKKDFLLLINKFDGPAQEGLQYEFFSLGIVESQVFEVSAAHGPGIENLREALVKRIEDFGRCQEKEEKTEIQLGVTPRENVIASLTIIGAPNSGKSTLLNALVGSKRSLVSSIAGTTVDPVDAFFDLYFSTDAEKLDKSVPLIRGDRDLKIQYEEFRKNNPFVYEELEKAYKQDYLVSSNYDSSQEEDDALDASESSENLGEDDFFKSDFDSMDHDALTKLEDESLEYQQGDFKDHSLILNLDEKVSEDVTSPEIELEVNKKGSFWRSIHLIDTAGIRKKSKVDSDLESLSVFRALKSIDEADLILHVIDASLGVSHQDRRLIDLALEKGKSVLVCLNKSDLFAKRFEKNKNEKKEWILDVEDQIPWTELKSFILISAKYALSLSKLKKAIKAIILSRKTVPSTATINQVLLELFSRHQVIPSRARGQYLKLRYATILKNDPPTFILFVNKSKGIPENYKRYLQNGLRIGLKIYNTPIHLIFRTGRDLEERMKKVTS